MKNFLYSLSLPPLVLFGIIELLCIGIFLILQTIGMGKFSPVALLLPFQILAWMIMIEKEYWLLLGFSLVFPLSGLELLPGNYWRLVFYPGTIILFIILRATQFLSEHKVMKNWQSDIPRNKLLLIAFLGLWTILTSVKAKFSGFAINAGMLTHYTILSIEMLAFLFLFATIPQDFRQMVTLIIVMSVVYSITCFTLPLFASGPQGALEGKTMVALFSGYINMNAFAVHILVASLLLLGIMLNLNSRGKLLAGLGIIILMAALVVTRSRGAWLGFFLGLFYLIAKTKSGILLVMMGIILAVLLTIDVFKTAIASRIAVTSLQDPSLAGRGILWAYALKVLKNNWLFGVGIENYRYVKHLFGFPAAITTASQYNTHNLFLELFVDLGLPGFLAFLWLKISVILGVERALKYLSGYSQYKQIYNFGAALNAALLGYATHSLWDCLIWQHGAFILLGVLLGLGVCFHKLFIEQFYNHNIRRAVS